MKYIPAIFTIVFYLTNSFEAHDISIVQTTI